MGSEMAYWAERVLVTAAEMAAIEERLFERGMPVAALMEKVAGRVARCIIEEFPPTDYPRVGILAGSGHNGGDALVIGRELSHAGYQVQVWMPGSQPKPLTAAHARYLHSLGIPFGDGLNPAWDLIVDGLLGIGLTRPVTGPLATVITSVNQSGIPVVSVDLPSGMDSDSGAILGTGIRAVRSFCLGLWKRALAQDQALDYLGQVSRIDFDIPPADILAVTGDPPPQQWLVPDLDSLPLQRPLATHKYRQGQVLLIGGSWRYPGAILLAGRGARASGVGMLALAVPATLKPWVTSHLPEAIVHSLPETPDGAIAKLDLDLSRYSAIAFGCGATLAAEPLLAELQPLPIPLLLDADGLNSLAQKDPLPWLAGRPALTLLTPHAGEYQRLFAHQELSSVARQSQAWILRKGARSALGIPNGQIFYNPESTPALARGGSGDVLAGLLAGLLAQPVAEPGIMLKRIQTGIWWHAQTGIHLAQQRSPLGVDPQSLADALLPTLQEKLQEKLEGRRLRKNSGISKAGDSGLEGGGGD
ncbi:MAG: NAD(P)H-hydrate dehydratase [Thermostichales cyanobacterium SZTDM-1c_bins_54]